MTKKTQLIKVLVANDLKSDYSSNLNDLKLSEILIKLVDNSDELWINLLKKMDLIKWLKKL